jgi:Protein of unknown function (DUF1588)/Protein of unknown function (DUF1592)/Protein of unknown function (DUF1585)/Protein of unknown function (DUF1595)/Protein of unknown function (DUF1587)/F5/8 type C domain
MRSAVVGAVVVWVASAFGIQSARAAEDVSFQKQIAPVLQDRCGKCHAGDKRAGDVSFSGIGDDKAAARQRKLWRKAVAQMEAGEMPPADETPLTRDERERLLGWMKRAIEVVDCSDPANRDPGPTIARRLSLVEYNRTVRDLMGFEYDAAAVGMPEELGEGNPFGNLAAALDVSPVLMDKYFAAADQILDRFFGTELSSSIDGRIQEQARVSREQMFGLNPGEWRKADYEVAAPKDVAPREAARALIAPFLRRAYRGQATAADVDRLLVLFDRAAAQGKSYGESVRWMLKGVLVSPKFLYRIEPNRAGRKPDKVDAVGDHELAVRLSYFLWASMPDDELLDLADRGKLTAAGPSNESVAFPGMVIAGPGSEKHQGNNHDKVFDGDLLTILDGPDANSYWVGLRLEQAWPIQRIRYAGRIGNEQRMIGGKFQASNSEDFSSDVVDLFEVTERPPRGWVTRDIDPPVSARYVRYVPPKNSYGNIAEIEVRGSAPGTVLEQQVRRMLSDPRARSLTDTFAARWLQINKLPTARPSTEFFPEFNANVRQAMFEETSLFFDSLRREDRSVLELLDADYTFVNEELARYYGLPDVTGKEMRRVSLTPEQHRGGLLGMGSVLSLTSHTSRTSPTLRGKYILEVLLGSPPPPPPANVSQIKEETDKKKEVQTFREKLTQHAENAACAACHRKMDPLGFALDNYNAVGLWRDKQGDQPLDVGGELPTGEKLNGVADLKKVLLARKSEFVRNLTEQLLTYALGRELDYYDDCPVQQITTELQKNDYRFSTLVMEIVKSYPFQNRRNGQTADTK